MLKTLSLVVLFAAACGSAAKQAPDTVATAGDQGGVQLALGEIKLVDVDKNQAVLIHADGTIELDSKKVAKVTADGKLVKLDTGEVGLTLDPGGTVTTPDGKDLGVKIGVDGTVTMGDKAISIAASGELVGGNPDGPKVKIEGATNDRLKRTAMFVLIALTLPGEVDVKAEGKPGTPE